MKQNFRMIDVGEKNITGRRALARGTIRMNPLTIEMIRKGESPKGNILAIAEVAGITAAKNTAGILPLCHPLLLDSVRLWFETQDCVVEAFCEVKCSAKTGVEMEALVGVNVCLLTIYDLAKAVDPVIQIENVYLDTKEGGKSGLWRHPKVQSSSPEKKPQSQHTYSQLNVAIGVLSDRASAGIYEDKSGAYIRDYCRQKGAKEEFYYVIPDDRDELKSLVTIASDKKVDVLFLTGGTGLGIRDITPETISQMATKELAGFGELQRQYGAQYTKFAWLSRSTAYVVKDTLVVLFPGSQKAVEQGLEAIGELVPHAINMMRGQAHS